MKRLILFLFLLLALVYAQGYWTEGKAVFTDNGNYWTASDLDSVVWTSDYDSLYIAGAETAYVFIRAGRTLGRITYKGKVTTENAYSHTADSANLVFEMALLKGLSYTSLDSDVSETFYSMATVAIAYGETGTFYFYPYTNANLDEPTLYYLLRIRGVSSTDLAKIYIKEERIRQY